MKTWKDVKVGAVIMTELGGYGYEVVKINEREFYYLHLGLEGDLDQEGIGNWDEGYHGKNITIIDWIEEDRALLYKKAVINLKCACDLYTQLLPYGCKCGGK